MEKVFFKIIVSNYNNMPYIKKCLDSILNLTFLDFKIIVVDDRSTDFSDDFCLMYSKNYPTKIIYHKLDKKGYAGACRNYGINYQICSEYTLFVDSDDELYNTTTLMCLYNDLVINKFPKVLVFGHESIITNTRSKTYVPNSVNDAISNCIAPWRKCVKSDISIEFVQNRAKANDVIYHLKLMDSISDSDIQISKNKYYKYRENSITSIWSSPLKNSYYAIWSDIHYIDDVKKCNFSKLLINELKDRLINERKNKYKNLVDLYLKSDKLQEITIAMATQPQRIQTAIETVKKLLPYCTRFCIALNGFDSIPNEFKNNSKIITILANNNPIKDLGCDNKMYWLGDYDGYYLTVDDDIDYPSNYVVDIIEKIMNYDDNVVCSYHGHTYQVVNGKIDTAKVTNYYFGTKILADTYCHKIGMGVAICNPKKIGIDKSIFLDKPKNFGDDEIVAVWAQEHNVPLVRAENSNVNLKDIKVMSRKNGLCFNKDSVKERNAFLMSYTNWKLNTYK